MIFVAQEGSHSGKKGVSWAWIITGLVVVVIGAALAIQAYENSIQYYMTTDEFVARQDDFVGKNLKIAGIVQAGSLKSESSRHEFVIEYNGEEFPVVYAGLAPDTFKEGAEVIVEGQGPKAGHFEAETLMAKCASKYEVGGLPPVELQN